MYKFILYSSPIKVSNLKSNLSHSILFHKEADLSPLYVCCNFARQQ